MAERGQSPFYPGQPVPVERFVGRESERKRLGNFLQKMKTLVCFVPEDAPGPYTFHMNLVR